MSKVSWSSMQHTLDHENFQHDSKYFKGKSKKEGGEGRGHIVAAARLQLV